MQRRTGLHLVQLRRLGDTSVGLGSSFSSQSLAAQPTFFIDPINGVDSPAVSALTLGTAWRSKSFFAQRTYGMSLTQAITVNVTSSLNAGDDVQPLIFGDVANGWSVNYVGVPTALVNGGTQITALVNQNGAGSQVTQMTCGNLSGTFTALGLVGKIVEWTDGSGHFVRGIVVKDLEGTLGTRTAWISPPISEANLTTTFTNGQTVNFWSLPSMRNVIPRGGYNTYKYLDAVRWEQQDGRTDMTNCTGQGALGFGGSWNLLNTALGERFQEDTTNGLATTQTTVSFYGGYNSPNLTGGSNGVVKASATFSMIQLESGSSFSTPGPGGTTIPDVEINSAVVVAPRGAINCNDFSPQQYLFSGFVYGTSLSTVLLRMQGVKGTAVFKHIPNVTNATTAFFDVTNVTENLSRLSSIQLVDTMDNRIIGPSGPSIDIDRLQIVKQARGILTETIDVQNMVGAVVTVSGTVYYMLVGLRAGDSIGNLTINVQSAGAGMTRSRVGLYDRNANLLAQSADQGASWQSVGQKVIPMITPFTVPATDGYYVAIIAIGTTQPTLSRGGNNLIGPDFAIGGGLLPFTGQLAQADLPNPGVLAAGVTSNVYWVAVSN